MTTAKGVLSDSLVASAREKESAILERLQADVFAPRKAVEQREEAARIRDTIRTVEAKAGLLYQIDEKLATPFSAEAVLKKLRAFVKDVAALADVKRAEAEKAERRLDAIAVKKTPAWREARAEHQALVRELEVLDGVRSIVEYGTTTDGWPVDLTRWRIQVPTSLATLWGETHGLPIDALWLGPLKHREAHRKGLLGKRGQLVKEIEKLMEQLGTLTT